MDKPIDAAQITDRREIIAVEAGEIEGEIYSDGEVWADRESLSIWRTRHAADVLGQNQATAAA